MMSDSVHRTAVNPVYSIQTVNQMTSEEFADAFGPVFEHSRWIAEKAWETGPFSGREGLLSAMAEVIWRTGEAEQLQLIRAHPDLAGKLELTAHSRREQQGAGLGLASLSEAEVEAFCEANAAYAAKFGFPFIMAVKGRTKAEIYTAMKQRLAGKPEAEKQRALEEIVRIARFRLFDLIPCDEGGTLVSKPGGKRTMYYGKGDVLVYRTYVHPLRVAPIPESAFMGNENVIFALNVKIAVRGEAFLPSFMTGDNSMVVATDSMKNFILRHAADFEGATPEAFLYFISGLLLARYEHMTAIEIEAERLPFDELPVPNAEGGFTGSPLVYRRSYNERSFSRLEVVRDAAAESGITVSKHACGLVSLQLIKVKGSSFAGFIRDEYTTLPETQDRPLFIWLNLGWEYEDIWQALSEDSADYVAPEQIRDIAYTVFHEEYSPSIQHLLWQIGRRVLLRFPQLSEVCFESNNRTWETVMETVQGTEGKVFTEPRPPYGFQGFSMTREDVAADELEAEGAADEAAASAELAGGSGTKAESGGASAHTGTKPEILRAVSPCYKAAAAWAGEAGSVSDSFPETVEDRI